MWPLLFNPPRTSIYSGVSHQSESVYLICFTNVDSIFKFELKLNISYHLKTDTLRD